MRIYNYYHYSTDLVFLQILEILSSMASLSFSHFLSFPSFFPRRHNCHQQLQLQQRPDLCRFRASSIGKSRRKVKTNAELCDDIREFITANGLPEGYVPTMKEFSQLGRSDLAYIVRRRGYKVIGEILGHTDKSGSSVEVKGDSDENAAFCDSGDIKITDRSTSLAENTAVEISSDSLVIDESEDGFSSTKLPIVENHVESQEISIETSSVGDNRIDPEASNDLSGKDIEEADEAEEASSIISGIDIDEAEEALSHISSTDIDEAEDGSLIAEPNSEEISLDSTSLYIESSQNGLHRNLNMVKDVAFLSTEILIDEPLPSTSISVYHSQVSYEHRETSEELSSLSLEDKVGNFMRHGHLDTLEESKSDGMLAESDIEECKDNIELVDENVQNGGNTDTNFNAAAVKPMTKTDPLRDANPKVPLNKDLDDKHEKELELSRLKEEIEKEKRAFSLLQAKAETEISKAQKLISEKDAELLAAEEMLTELVEVQIIYHGNGELVEVAGSFNGWHHWIKMDLQPLSSTTYTTESRKSKIWSTMLWFYPGIYEIKFVVDGEWRIDPRMESVSNGTICNNILRVHR